MRTRNETVKVVTGATAILSVWNPDVAIKEDYSAASITIIDGHGPQQNYVQAGWMVCTDWITVKIYQMQIIFPFPLSDFHSVVR